MPQTAQDSAPANSSGAASQGTLSPITDIASRSDIVRELVVSLAPALTLLASITAAAGASSMPPPRAEPSIAEETVPANEPLGQYAPVPPSPATMTVQAMARVQIDHFYQNFRFAATLLINGQRPFTFVEPILQQHVTSINHLVGEQWASNIAQQIRELKRLSGNLYRLRFSTTLEDGQEIVSRLRTEQEQIYSELNQLVTNKKEYVRSVHDSREQLRQEYQRKKAEAQKEENALAQDRVMLEDLQRRVQDREQQLQSYNQELLELVNRDTQLAQELSVAQASLPEAEERLANTRLLSEEELRRRAVEELMAAREQEAAELVQAIKALTGLE